MAGKGKLSTLQIITELFDWESISYIPPNSLPRRAGRETIPVEDSTTNRTALAATSNTSASCRSNSLEKRVDEDV